MLIPLDNIISRYKLNIKGVIHIGAHYGQEYSDYVKCGIKNMMFFEPVKSTYEVLIKTVPVKDSVFIYNLALGNFSGQSEMFIETNNKGMSSSLLVPKLHLYQYPKIVFDKKETVFVEKLDNIDFVRSDFNMINIDVQGYELEVFKGAKQVLEYIDIIYTEVNFDEVYTNCCRVEDLDKFLGQYNFIRIKTDKRHITWGDALYIKYT